MDLTTIWDGLKKWILDNGVVLVAALSFCVGAVTTVVGWGIVRRWSDIALIKNEYTVTELAAAIQAIAITAGLASIWLMWRQSRENNRWNKLVIYHQHFDNLPSGDLARQTHEVVRHFMAGLIPSPPVFIANHPDLDHSANMSLTDDQRAKLAASYFVGRGTQIEATICANILAHPPSARVVRQFLDAFELLCGAVNCGVLNDAYARELEFTRVCRSYAMFELLIQQVRQGGNTQAYVELEAVADRWQEFKKKQYDRTQKKSESLKARQKKVARSVGVPREF